MRNGLRNCKQRIQGRKAKKGREGQCRSKKRDSRQTTNGHAPGGHKHLVKGIRGGSNSQKPFWKEKKGTHHKRWKKGKPEGNAGEDSTDQGPVALLKIKLLQELDQSKGRETHLKGSQQKGGIKWGGRRRRAKLASKQRN